MAAATVSGRKQNRVASDIRVVSWSAVTFASNGDTLAVPGLKSIQTVMFQPTTNTAPGFTISGNTLTIVSGGALTGLLSVHGL